MSQDQTRKKKSLLKKTSHWQDQTRKKIREETQRRDGEAGGTSSGLQTRSKSLHRPSAERTRERPATTGSFDFPPLTPYSTVFDSFFAFFVSARPCIFHSAG